MPPLKINFKFVEMEWQLGVPDKAAACEMHIELTGEEALRNGIIKGIPNRSHEKPNALSRQGLLNARLAY